MKLIFSPGSAFGSESPGSASNLYASGSKADYYIIMLSF